MVQMPDIDRLKILMLMNTSHKHVAKALESMTPNTKMYKITGGYSSLIKLLKELK